MIKSSDSSFDDKQTFKKYKLMSADNKPIVSDSPGTYGGHRKTKVYGRMNCRAA